MIALAQMRAVFAAGSFGGGGPPTTAATWNPLDTSTGANLGALSNGNLSFAGGSVSGNAATRCTVGHEVGKYYWEIEITTLGTASNTPYMGIVDDSQDADTLVSNYGPFSSDPHVRGAAIASPSSSGHFLFSPGSAGTNVQAPTLTGDVFMFAVDLTLNVMWVGKDGTWDSGNPALGTSPSFILPAVELFPTVMVSDSLHSDLITGRFASADMTQGPPSGFAPWEDATAVTDFSLVWLQVTGDSADVSGGIAHDIGPYAGGNRGIGLSSGATASGGYIVVGSAVINTTDAGSGTILSMPWPARFSFELTINYPDVTTAQVVFDCRPAFTDPGGMIMTLVNTGFVIYDVTTTAKATVTGVFTANTDHKIGIFRDEVAGVRTVYVFVDGVLATSYTDNSNYLNQQILFLFGTAYNTAVSGAGSKIKDLRITRGKAHHVANYTPSTPFPTS